VNATVPAVAEWLLARSLHASERDLVLGDVEEEFHHRLARVGLRAARRWYWRQVLGSLWPNLRRRLARRRRDHSSLEGSAMDALMQDVRYAWRMMRRRPLVSSVALMSLTAGIVLPSIVFSLLNAVVLRPLSVADPESLALVLEVRSTGLNHNFPHPDFVDYRAAQRTFVDLTAYSADDVTVRRGAEALVVPAEFVSGSYFTTIGPRMHLGRALSVADDVQGAAPVAVMSESLWRRLHIGTDLTFSPGALIINEQRFDIVGVVAAPFRGMQVGRDAGVWVPLAARGLLDPQAARLFTARTASWLTLMGRLKPGVTFDAARDDINRVEAALAPAVGRARPRIFTVAAGRQGDSMLPATARAPLVLLLGAALLVLLVACANVANLLIARATERAREMAVRTALGAGRGRIARLVVIDASMLAIIGAAVALVTTPVLVRQVVPFLGRFGEPVTLDVGADWRVLAFVSVLVVVVTILSGLAPVAASLRASMSQALAEGGRSASAGRLTARVRQSLVVVQFALALALVVVAALLTRTVYNLRTLPTGLDVDHVALLSVQPDAAQFDRARTTSYVARALARLAAAPGVREAGFARVPPLGFGGSRMTVIVPGYTASADEDMELNFNRVTPEYAEAVGLELLGGRWIDARDTGEARGVVVVNETMARRYWGGTKALGTRVRFSDTGPDVEVIGIVRDVKYRMLREEAHPSFYVPVTQMAAPAGVFHVRTAGDPRTALQALRQVLMAVDPIVPVTVVRTLREQADINVSDERLAMLIASVLGAVALALAALGLYASMSFIVGQRVREIGLRVALGATRAGIRRLVLGQALWLALAGTLCGAMLALWFGRLIETRL
jgi:predicted permease